MNLKAIITLLAITSGVIWGAEAQNVDTNFSQLLSCTNRTYANASIKSVSPASEKT
jgi:hypothetical protein